MASEGVDGCAFLGDLQFLLATEDQLNEDLSLLCDLLSENSPSDQTTGGSRSMSTSDAMENATAALLPTKKIALTCIPIHHVSFAPSAAGHVAIEYPATGARNRFQYRQRQEIRLLRQQVDALKKTLAATMAYHHASNALQRRSVWKQAADQERLACKRAIAENTQLQHAIREQATFIDRMQKVIVKKPRIAAIATEAEAWKSCKLVAHRPLRIAAIHAIADRQLSRMQSALIQAGVFNELNDKFFARAQPVNDNQLVMTFVSHVRIPAPYRTVAASCWQALAEAQDPSLPDGASEECEMVDPNTVYRRFTQVVDSIPAHSNVIRKYYPDGHQDVIVWRNVLEDALAPHLSLGAIDNEWGWLVVAPIQGDPRTCRVTFLHQVFGDRNPRSCPPGAMAIDATNQTIEAFRFCQRPADPGRFSGTPAAAVDDPDKFVQVYMSKGKRFELALCAAVDNAILVTQSPRFQVHSTT